MSSRSEIRINFMQAIHQAEQLESVADRLNKLARNKMESSMRNLSNAWKGQNATEFLAKEDCLQGNIEKTANEIRNIASDIRTIAGRIYDAEMTALRIAEERNS